MRRAVPYFLTAVALIAVACAGGGILARAQEAADQAARMNAGSPATTAAKSALVVASGAKFANVRGLAADASGGLYISLSETPAPQDCVSSAISVPQIAEDHGADSESTENASELKPALTDRNAGAAKIPLTIFSNCMAVRAEDPSGIAVASGDSVFLANRAQNSIRLLDMITGKVSPVPLAANGKFAARGASSNLDPNGPAGLAAGRDGNLYVADRGNGRILALHEGAERFSYVAHVLDAAAVAVNAAGTQLFVVSPLGNRVFVIDLRNDVLDVFAGSGAPADSASALSAQLDSNPTKSVIGAPEGVAVDGAGNVFIADTGANALLRVDAATGELARVKINVKLNLPGALAIDRHGDVFVADRGNARVLEFAQLASPQAAGAITISPATFDFGAEPTGGSAPVQQFTLTNGSASALALSNQDFTFVGANPADFSQSNNCVPSLPAGGSCLINVTFTPSASGARSATLQVADADPSSPQTAAVSGTGDDFQLTAGAQVDTIQNVAPGQTATYMLSVTPDSTFSGNVALACPAIISGKTQTIQCSIKPASVALMPSQPQTFTVTLTTGGPNATRVISFERRENPGSRRQLLLLCFCALAILLCILWMQRARDLHFAGAPSKRRRFAAFSFALLAIGAAAGFKYKAPPVNPNETPPGIYTFDITGSAQNASRAITLTLNVE